MVSAAIIAVFGLVVLVTGWLPVGRNLVARGRAARLISLLTFAPWPLTLGLGFAVGISLAVTNPELAIEPTDWRFTVIEGAVLVAIVGLVSILGRGVAKNQRILRTWEDECDRLTDEYERARRAPPPTAPTKAPVTCQRCSATLRVPVALVGKTVPCPKCQFPVAVPPGIAAAAIPLKRQPPILPAPPRTRGFLWFAMWTLAAVLVIVAPTVFTTLDLAAYLPRSGPRSPLDPFAQTKAPWDPMKDAKKADDFPKDENDPGQKANGNDDRGDPIPKVDVKVGVVPGPKEIVKDASGTDPKFKPPAKDPPVPNPSQPAAKQVVVVPGRETPPWTAASFSADAPAKSQAADLWISEANGVISNWSRQDAKRGEAFKADRPLGVMIATRLGIFGQFADPQSKIGGGAGNILVWNPTFRSDAEPKPRPPIKTIPYKGSIGRFVASNGSVVFLDVTLNQVGEVNGNAIGKTAAIKSPKARALDITPDGATIFVLCANNMVEVFERRSLAFKSKFELDGADITDLAAMRSGDRKFLLLIGKSAAIPTTCFAADVTDADLSRPLAVVPLAIDHPCHSVTRNYFLGEKTITSVVLSPPPTQVAQQQTVDLPARTSPGRVALSADLRLMAIPGGPILGLE